MSFLQALCCSKKIKQQKSGTVAIFRCACEIIKYFIWCHFWPYVAMFPSQHNVVRHENISEYRIGSTNISAKIGRCLEQSRTLEPCQVLEYNARHGIMNYDISDAQVRNGNRDTNEQSLLAVIFNESKCNQFFQAADSTLDLFWVGNKKLGEKVL